MSETPPKTLGKYEIRGELGKGAMGVVYTGFDRALDRKVAIKVMGAAVVSDPDLKKRFEQEAKASAKLQHPNIVTVYDFGYDDQGAPYMAMELLDGHDLEERIRKSPLTLREKLDVVRQTCIGLAHAWDNKIVHRDIKPANIFITKSGIAKIMDFGVARLTETSQTQTGTVLGTADYMSPEQIRGQKVDGRSDIFSAGVILYRLLTNKKPFVGENIQAVFFKVLNQAAPDLVLPDDGGEMPELQAIVDKALMKAKEERYESAKDFAADINDLMTLYQDILDENTLFDTMFDPSVATEMEHGSEGSGRRPTSPSGRVLGATSSGSRTHRAGTAFPTTGRTRPGATGVGRTATGTATQMMRRTQVGTMSATRVGVGIPLQESSGGVFKWVGLVALLAAVGGGVFWLTQRSAPPEVSAGAGSAPAQPRVDVAAQFQLAERSLAAGQLSQALIAVDAILFAEPNNEDAVALKERVNEAMENMQVAPPVVAQPVPAQPVPRGPSNTERATALAADASLSIGAGDLAQAEALIVQGRQLDPGSSRWQQLDQQLRRAREDGAARALASEQQAQIDQYIVEATAHLKAQNYESAIAAYDKALAVAPNNPQLINARNMAQTAMQQAAAATSLTALSIQESPTEFTARGQTEKPRGFEAGGVNVKRATSAPVNPADLIVQIVPVTVQPGDPYFLRVRLYNRGNRPIGVKSIELVSTFGSRTTGRGQPLQPRVQRVNPKDTSLIWEVQNTWTEEQNTGKIEAVVTLIGDAQLRKTIEWR